MSKPNGTIPYKVMKQNADTLTPIGIFQALKGNKKFLLESSYRHEQKGRYSFIGSNPYGEIISKGQSTTIIDYDKQTKKVVHGCPLDVLKQYVPNIKVDLPFPFYGGAVGYIGYDVAVTKHLRNIRNLPDDLNMPHMHVLCYQSVIVFDHQEEMVYVVALNRNNDPESVLDERIKEYTQSVTTSIHEPITKDVTVQFKPEMNQHQFMKKVITAQQRMQTEETQQVVLSQRMKAAFQEHPFTFYRKLRKVNPSPYMFYIDFEKYVVLGASPESLLRVQGNHVELNPIAGTHPRGTTDSKDEQNMQKLLTDQKEIAEHDMLVELSKSDLQHVCKSKSITVPVHRQVEKYEHVMHIVSEVHGTLATDKTSLDALRICLPAGTVSGYPKLRAMEMIQQLEEKTRGLYGGGIGYLNFNGDLNMALAIRSLIIKDGKAFLQTGAGIVNDSIPEKEYQETLHKAKSLMNVSAYKLASDHLFRKEPITR